MYYQYVVFKPLAIRNLERRNGAATVPAGLVATMAIILALSLGSPVPAEFLILCRLCRGDRTHSIHAGIRYGPE